MAKEKRVFKEAYDIGDAIAVPWTLPGGRNFLFRLVLWGTALLLGVYALFGRTFLSGYAEFLKATLTLESAGEQADPEQVFALFGQMSGLFVSGSLMMIFIVLVLSAVETALHKNGFRGTDEGAFPLRFGKDELRVLLAKIVVSVSVGCVYIGGGVVLSLLFALAVALGVKSSALGLVTGVLIIAAIIGFFVLLVRCAISWAPAAAMSVRDDRVRLFEGWGAVKGRSWPVFGTYLVVFLIGYFTSYMIMAIGGYIAFGSIDFLSVLSGKSTDIDAVFAQMGEVIKQPRVYIPLVIVTIIYAAFMVLWYLHIYSVGHYVARLQAKENGLS